MNYICLMYHNESLAKELPQTEMEEGFRECQAFTEEIKKSGHYVATNALQPTHTATCLRVRNGKTATTDGPFAETKEQLGGYYLIHARDLNEALSLASRIPGARWGTVEVRPVMQAS